MYKNAVIRFFSKEPLLLIAKEAYIKKFVNKNNKDVLMVMYLPTEQKAIEAVKEAAKPWEGYTIGA
jgi:uncharacterized membrane protein (UPF0127 family)